MFLEEMRQNHRHGGSSISHGSGPALAHVLEILRPHLGETFSILPIPINELGIDGSIDLDTRIEVLVLEGRFQGCQACALALGDNGRERSKEFILESVWFALPVLAASAVSDGDL